ncbi:efflux RND transporter permease subunit [Synechocystis salina]|uniref:Efflux RND transporter permease subunit n=1 Tax=Synechocystis salina LEGE 00031 TaxID=1828736 RepID=A0ABR9VQ15_9SYNC|nr:efflux RND transporter permease subunit [Synechocystis salina]MBE9242813.1 efflux RND transporter permease subunit [Synechocystis salina LEGE 00041]MBE9253440.1 efflux RND transporter permease subunit [Synechocystis salina LEGE 00031]
MFSLFYRNGRLLLLTLILVLVWGVTALFTLPRMEDPELVQRFGTVTTSLPGATPERVEALITEKIEDKLLELEEISVIESTSSRGLSIIEIELDEAIQNVDPVWSKVRSELNDVVPLLPSDASEPEYEAGDPVANALIVGLTWELDRPANFNLLQRVGDRLVQQLRELPGTKQVEMVGDVPEEIQVEIQPADLVRLGLTPRALAQQIAASDAKVSAGQLRSPQTDLLIEIDSNLQTLEQIRQIPIKVATSGESQRLGHIAQVSKGVQAPPSSLALIGGKPAIAIAATVESSVRVDQWAKQAQVVLTSFEQDLGAGLGLTVVLDQSQYVQQRLNGVWQNLLVSSGLVIVVSLAMLGLKAALVVGTALPLATLMVFGAMGALNIPLHQMSVTGLIIALGLLIDNAIVVVDEVQHHLQQGMPPEKAVADTVQHLWIPLLASTLTTVLAFVPIAFSPGATGEFIGAIGATVILALVSSLLLSLTVIVTFAGKMAPWQPFQRYPWLQTGVSHAALARAYRWSLEGLFRRPWLTIGLCLVLPLGGFWQFAQLEQQFFPPTNRDQFQIQWTLPAATAINATQAQVQQARDLILEYPDVADVHWFLGESAPAFFYNVIPDRENAANYAQGIVQLRSKENLRNLIQNLQQALTQAFPEAQVLVRQLEQGPPLAAPIELRLSGSNLRELRLLGDQLRRELSTIENVIHTQANLSEALPKLALQVDEVQARLVGLDHQAIANQLQATLEGVTGGSVLEATEDLPVRVRVNSSTRQDLDQIRSLDLLTPSGELLPLVAIADMTLVPGVAQINRYNGKRINTVQGFLTAGALPSNTLAQLQEQLQAQNFLLPPGYDLAYGGEADAQGTAVANLLGLVGILVVTMAATLILSFNSFRLAALIGSVALWSVGLAALALWLFQALFGFTAILGTLGLIGLAINDSIVVLAALQENPLARVGHAQATSTVVLKATRHVLATTFTTIIGFTPLLLDETGFWPPLAIALAGGLGGATLLALYYVPAAHLLLMRSHHPLNKPLSN